MSTPHKHAEVIKAWADGAAIECRQLSHESWQPCIEPRWFSYFDYRVKPPREFPKSTLTYGDLCHVVNEAAAIKTSEGIQTVVARLAADAAVKQYILDSER
jgi:hypothetical protein